MSKNKKIASSTLSATFLLIASVVNANPSTAATENNIHNTFSPFLGRALFSGTATNATIGVFSGDVMQPIFGNQNGFLYGDVMGDYGTDDTYQASPGLGYRQVFNNQIIGAYAFTDYERTSLGENFWVLSPGIELITPHWDAHVNGYFPTTTTQQTGPAVFANTLGDNSYVTFQEGTHNQYDALITPYDMIGNGGDAEIGYSFAGPHNYRERIYAGTYYYQPPSSIDYNVDNIFGVTAGFEQPLSKNVKLSVFNSYDQVSNYTVGVGLSVTFGGDSNLYTNNVQDRLFDQVQRHIGIIATGAGTYDQQGSQYSGIAQDGSGTVIEYTDVYFVSPNGTGNGTFGNPAPLDQATFDNAQAEYPGEGRIYVQGGTDAIYTVDVNTATDTEGDYLGLYVYPGQGVYGRTPDYTAAATSDAQPQIETDVYDNYSAFITTSGNNTFSDLTITNTTDTYLGGSGNGIYAFNESGTATLNIINTNITNVNNGVDAEDNSTTGSYTINVTNSTFNDENSYLANFYVHSLTDQPIIINITDSNFNNNQNAANGFFAQTNTATGSLTMNVTGSEFNGNTEGGNGFGIQNLNGTDAFAIDLNITDSQFNDNTGNGFNLDDEGNTTWNVTLDNSNFNDNTYEGVSVDLSGTSNMTVTNSNFNNNGDNGLEASNNTTNTMTLNITGSEFNDNDSESSTTGNTGDGLYAVNQSSGTLAITLTDSQFNGNNTSLLSSPAGLGGAEVDNMATGTVTLAVDHSEFNNNGDHSSGLYVDNENQGVTTVNITNASEFNGNAYYGLNTNTRASTGDGMTITIADSSFNSNTLSGLFAEAYTGTYNLTITGSDFSSNTQDGIQLQNGSGNMSVTAETSTFNNNDIDGLSVYNSSAVGTLNVTSLANSSFSGNAIYDIYGLGNSSNPSGTSIHYTNATDAGSLNTNRLAPNTYVDWY